MKRPTLEELQQQINAQLRLSLPEADPAPHYSVLGVLVQVFAGLCHSLYGYLSWMHGQLFPDTAQGEYLERWAALWALRRREPVKARGMITVVGASATVVPKGTEWKRIDGTRYQSLATVSLLKDNQAFTTQVEVEAKDSGEGGNLSRGASLAIVGALPGVVSEAKVSTAISDGAGSETDAELRLRLMERITAPPGIGSKQDYLDAATKLGLRAWVYAAGERYEKLPGKGFYHVAPGQVWLHVAEPRNQLILLPLTKLRKVENSLQAQAPVGATVVVRQLQGLILRVNITRINPDTLAVRKAVEAALDELVRVEIAPQTVMAHSRIAEAIATATGEESHAFTAEVLRVKSSIGSIIPEGAPIIGFDEAIASVEVLWPNS